MDCKKALKSGTIALALLVAAISITQQQQVQATNAFDQGYNSGRNDRQDGHEKNSYCPDGNSDATCTAYKLGYEAGWIATSFLHGNETPRDDIDVRDRTDSSNNDGDDDDN